MNASTRNNAIACRKAAGAALLIGLAGLAAGCESMERADRYIDRQWTTPSHMLPPQKLAIAVRRDDVSTSVTYAPRAAALSAFERDQLARFVARSGAASGDRAVIALSPAGGRALAARRVQLLARDFHRQGLNVVRSFGPGEPNAATITITRMVAVAPDCPQWQDLMQRSQVDEYQPKLGCITASTLATSVHRPMDLVSGRPTGPSDGVVMTNGIDALRAGKFDPPVSATGTGSPQAGQTGQQAK